MTFQATVLNVMIASPGDVARERVIARDVILEWNAINASDRSLVLMPVGWESHSTPSMSDRPQAVINSQVLEHCDVLIAIFWTRLGTPTGEFASGTAEEIEKHLAAEKPAMIYFSNAPVVPDSINPGQYQAMTEFRDSLMQRGLVSMYDDAPSFRNDLFRHLSQTVIRDFTETDGMPEIAVPTQSDDPAIGDAARELLLATVSDRSGRIMYLKYIGGTDISTNGRNFVDDRNPRTLARWESALEELERLGFISERGTKREVFAVTDRGYAYAESLGVITES